jgi:hypothetical protein
LANIRVQSEQMTIGCGPGDAQVQVQVVTLATTSAKEVSVLDAVVHYGSCCDAVVEEQGERGVGEAALAVDRVEVVHLAVADGSQGGTRRRGRFECELRVAEDALEGGQGKDRTVRTEIGVWDAQVVPESEASVASLANFSGEKVRQAVGNCTCSCARVGLQFEVVSAAFASGKRGVFVVNAIGDQSRCAPSVVQQVGRTNDAVLRLEVVDVAVREGALGTRVPCQIEAVFAMSALVGLEPDAIPVEVGVGDAHVVEESESGQTTQTNVGVLLVELAIRDCPEFAHSSEGIEEVVQGTEVAVAGGLVVLEAVCVRVSSAEVVPQRVANRALDTNLVVVQVLGTPEDGRGLTQAALIQVKGESAQFAHSCSPSTVCSWHCTASSECTEGSTGCSQSSRNCKR